VGSPTPPPPLGGGTHGPLWVQPKAGFFFAEKCLISPLFDPYSWVPRDPPRGSSDPPWGGGIGRTPSGGGGLKILFGSPTQPERLAQPSDFVFIHFFGARTPLMGGR